VLCALQRLGIAEAVQQLSVIHVAGTKGKVRRDVCCGVAADLWDCTQQLSSLASTAVCHPTQAVDMRVR
jgi:hypothetical protein